MSLYNIVSSKMNSLLFFSQSGLSTFPALYIHIGVVSKHSWPSPGARVLSTNLSTQSFSLSLSLSLSLSSIRFSESRKAKLESRGQNDDDPPVLVGGGGPSLTLEIVAQRFLSFFARTAILPEVSQPCEESKREGERERDAIIVLTEKNIQISWFFLVLNKREGPW